MNSLPVQEPAKCDRSNDREFSASVAALYVRRRIALGVSEFLGARERFHKADAVGAHVCQHKVRSSIENPEYFVDVAGRETLLYRVDYRYSSAD